MGVEHNFKYRVDIQFRRPDWRFTSALSAPYATKDEAFMSLVKLLRKARKQHIAWCDVVIYEFNATNGSNYVIEHRYDCKAQPIKNRE